MDIKLSIRAEELGLDFDLITQQATQSINQGVQALAQATFNTAIELAHEKLSSTQQDYINALSFSRKKIGKNVFYEISLSDSMNWIEDGFPGYDMKPGLLNGPKSRVNKQGKRYNIVPFRHKPFGKAGGSSNSTRAKLQNELSATIKKYGLDQIIKDSNNRALEGRVKSLTNKGLLPNLQGLTKYQKRYKSVIQSTYMTFRVVSENSSPSSWIHPGYRGANIFPELEKYVDEQIDEILTHILS